MSEFDAARTRHFKKGELSTWKYRVTLWCFERDNIEAIARGVTMGNKLGDKGRRHAPRRVGDVNVILSAMNASAKTTTNVEKMAVSAPVMNVNQSWWPITGWSLNWPGSVFIGTRLGRS
jgi:hypothetical protein